MLRECGGCWSCRATEGPVPALVVIAGLSLGDVDPARIAGTLSDHKDASAGLIEKGVNVNTPDVSGLTPLHYASMTEFGDAGKVQELLAAGANGDTKEICGIRDGAEVAVAPACSCAQ